MDETQGRLLFETLEFLAKESRGRHTASFITGLAFEFGANGMALAAAYPVYQDLSALAGLMNDDGYDSEEQILWSDDELDLVVQEVDAAWKRSADSRAGA